MHMTQVQSCVAEIERKFREQVDYIVHRTTDHNAADRLMVQRDCIDAVAGAFLDAGLLDRADVYGFKDRSGYFVSVCNVCL